MKKLKLDGKMELTKDEMKKINGGLYGCYYQNYAHCGGGEGTVICDSWYYPQEIDCFMAVQAWCLRDDCCDFIEC